MRLMALEASSRTSKGIQAIQAMDLLTTFVHAPAPPHKTSQKEALVFWMGSLRLSNYGWIPRRAHGGNVKDEEIKYEILSRKYDCQDSRSVWSIYFRTFGYLIFPAIPRYDVGLQSCSTNAIDG